MNLPAQINSVAAALTMVELRIKGLEEERAGLEQRLKSLNKLYSEQCNMTLPLWGDRKDNHEEKGQEGVEVSPQVTQP